MKRERQVKIRFEPRYCEFCEGIIEQRHYHTPKEYGVLRFCSRSCIVSGKHHKGVKKADLPVKDPKFTNCRACEKPLYRREEESLQAWIKRQFCSKSCAGTGRRGTRIPFEVIKQDEMKRLGCRQIAKGSEEFKKLEQLYGGARA